MTILLPLAAQPVLRLKPGQHLRQPAESAGFERRRAEPTHYVVQFRHLPNRNDKALLESRGLRVLEYLPDNAFVVFGSPSANLSNLDIQWLGRIEAEEKVSATLSTPDLSAVIVELQQDSDGVAVRSAAINLGAEVLENPDLDSRHLLVRAMPDVLAELAKLDEVSYIFPASLELENGTPTVACHSGLANLAGEEIMASNLTAVFGDGWDGPGLGSASLTFWFGNLTPSLPNASVMIEIQRALSAWSQVVNVDFQQTSSSSSPRSIDILFALGDHGDGTPFDGPGKVIAHTFYPPPNPESIAGDMHFDLAESWRIGADIDVFSVALHELGHALGLGHSDDPNSVMYPYYRKVTQLQQGDIGAIKTLYAARLTEQSPPTDPEIPTTPSVPSAPAVRIMSPASGGQYPTTSATLTLTGIVESTTAVQRIEWKSSRGPSGLARGGSSWSAGPVPLLTGSNLIQITAYLQGGAIASAALEAVLTSTQQDYTPPSIRITSPSLNVLTTSASVILVRGTASDNTAISAITWSNSTGGSGIVEGTAVWSTPPIALAIGANVITIRAQDTTGNQSWRTVLVNRR